MADLHAEEVTDDLLKTARHLHVASYFLQTGLQAGLPRLLERAHALGLTASLDTNWDPADAWLGFDRLLPLVDVFLPNENEALAISRQPTVEKALAVLQTQSPLVGIKLGSLGGVASDMTATVRAPSLPVKVEDTVGAGDTFDAGFLYGYLHGWQLEKSLRLACACGSLSTQRHGGTEGQPTLPEALQAMA
jgi:sugar/nucleoside kinase (ribokinase family)